MNEFFGFGGYKRTPEGFMSWQHLVYSSVLTVAMIVMAIILGRFYKNKDEKRKNKVLLWTGIILNTLWILKIIILSIRGNNPRYFLIDLPLFLCSIMFIAVPLAAFTKGRIREAALVFIFIFGILAGTMGNYGAGQNFNAYPVLSFDNIVSGLTHSISGFISLFVGIAGLTSMKKNNIWITFLILVGFCVLAYIADITIPYNYMFLMRGDGTPYDIFYNLVNGNRVLYPMIVVGLFLLYIAAYYGVYYLIFYLNKKHKQKEQPAE